MSVDTPVKKKTQTQRILELLQTRGSASSLELNHIAFRYSARIAELRADGHIIATTRQPDGLFRFTYQGVRDEV